MTAGAVSLIDAAMTGATQARLLDAAERQFADRGFEGASLRQITSEAGVNLAAPNYHFGDKESLFAAVFVRRARAINRDRLARLEAMERAERPPSVADLVAAVIEPMRELWLGTSDGSPHPFLRCMARTLLDPQPFMRGLVQAEFAPFFARLLPALQAAIPGLDRTLLITRVQAMMGALLFTGARMARFGPVGGAPLASTADAETALREVTAFCIAGLGAPAPEGGSTRVP